MSKQDEKGPERDLVDRLVAAYDTMLGRVNETLERIEQKGLPSLRGSIDHARERAIELGELTREEADRIAGYVQRDMEDAAHFLADTGEEIRDWLRFDLRLVETRLLDVFARVADQTSLQLRELAERARRSELYHTGEVTGPGTLVCSQCAKELHFHKPGRIPPCPACHSTEFRRPTPQAEQSDDDGV